MKFGRLVDYERTHEKVPPAKTGKVWNFEFETDIFRVIGLGLTFPDVNFCHIGA